MSPQSSRPARLRVSVVALFITAEQRVLVLHQMTPPEPDRWDLPGGGLEPHEAVLAGLRREVAEETGIEDFEVVGLLAIAEGFYERPQELLHTLNLIYQGRVEPLPATLVSRDPQEVGPRGLQWLPARELRPDNCTSRCWQALVAAGLREAGSP